MAKTITYSILKSCIHRRVPVSDFIDYDVALVTSEDVQSRLHADLEQIAGINPFYVKTFLARYIDRLESLGAPVSDDIYELYCLPSILGAKPLSPTTPDTLSYTIDESGNSLTIVETPKVISGLGTTGLRTWEAALYLASYLNHGKGPILENLSVVELGAGTGLVSLSLAKNYKKHRFAHLTVTDGDTAVVESMKTSITSNNLENVPTATMTLIWGSEYTGMLPAADIVVAADVTYDGSVVPELAATLSEFFRNGAREAYIAATVRNEDTLEVWEKALLEFRWSICARSLDPHSDCEEEWYRQNTPEIRIYKLQGLKE